MTFAGFEVTAVVSALGQRVARRLGREEAQALTEYAIILFLIAVASVGVLWAAGVDIATMFDTFENGFGGDSGEGPNNGPDPTP
jgi:Flp pilus assembly pilin Flp